MLKLSHFAYLALLGSSLGIASEGHSFPEFADLNELELGSIEIVNEQTGEVVDTQLYEFDGVQKIKKEKSVWKALGTESSELDPTASEFDLKALKEVVVLGLDILDTVYNWLEKRKPEVLVENRPLAFVPTRGEEKVAVSPLEMSGWSAPVTITYSLVFKNLYGMKMAQVKLSPTMTYGGSYNGSGAYLQGVQVGSEVSAHIGVKAKVRSELVSVTNMGTLEDPILGCVVNAVVSVGTIISQHELTYRIYYSADGNLRFL